MTDINFAKLAEPFPADDIEWRVQQSGVKDGKPWAMVLAYVTNRAIMDRLDDVVGPENWGNQFTPGPVSGLLCGISIRVGVDQWVTKWDGAENTDIEATKGGLSNSMKRAAVQWGIGRYLYGLTTGWAKFCDNGRYSAKIKETNKYHKWNPPDLPAWALPAGIKASQKPEPTTDDPVVLEWQCDKDSQGEIATYLLGRSIDIQRFFSWLLSDKIASGEIPGPIVTQKLADYLVSGKIDGKVDEYLKV